MVSPDPSLTLRMTKGTLRMTKGTLRMTKGTLRMTKDRPFGVRTYFSVLISDFDFGLLNILHTFAAAEERPITGTDAAGCAW